MSFVTTVVAVVNFIGRAKKREKLYNFFKYFLCFFLPIIFITNETFKWKYGNYRIQTQNFLQFCADNLDRALFVIVCFGAVFGLAYGLEKKLLPVMGLFTGKWKLEEQKEFKGVVNKAFQQGFGMELTKQELREARKEFEKDKLEFFEWISFIPVFLSLWVVYLSMAFGWYIVILVVPIILLHWYILKGLNSAIGLLGR